MIIGTMAMDMVFKPNCRCEISLPIVLGIHIFSLRHLDNVASLLWHNLASTTDRTLRFHVLLSVP